MSNNLLINTSDLTKLISENKVGIIAKAHRVTGVDGWVMVILVDDIKKTLSTYLSDNPRLFKRSDALLKEAEKMGLPSVTFEFC